MSHLILVGDSGDGDLWGLAAAGVDPLADVRELRLAIFNLQFTFSVSFNFH